MGRFLLVAAAVVAAFFLLGTVMGIITTLLKWALIIGLVVLAVGAVTKISRSRTRS